MNRLKNYFVDSARELQHVTWPTQRQAARITGIVIAFIIISAIVVGIVDWALSLGFTSLIQLS